MKRFLFFVLFCLNSFIFAQEKNIIFSKTYPIAENTNVNINLSKENLTISSYHGDEILVEVSSNNQNLLPEIKSEDQTFTIQKSKTDFNKGDNCSIFVYVPFESQIENYDISVFYGTLEVKDVKASETIKISTETANPKVSNIDCNFFDFQGSDADIEINQLKSAYFTILSTAGSIKVYLKSAPVAKSLCRIKDGPIFMSIPRNEAFEIVARSSKSMFINNFTKTEQRTTDWKTFSNGTDGAEITLQSFSGDITLAP